MTKQEAIDAIREKFGDEIYPTNHCCYGEEDSIADEIYGIIDQIDTDSYEW